jgi:hypothetical protein
VSAEGKPLHGAVQEQLHGEVYEECLEHLAAVQRRHLSVGPVLQAAGRSELLGSLS